MTVFENMARHGPDAVQSFARLTKDCPNFVNAWTLTAVADYLLHIYCADLRDLNRVIHDLLLPHEAVAPVQSQIVMDAPKTDAPLPL